MAVARRGPAHARQGRCRTPDDTGRESGPAVITAIAHDVLVTSAGSGPSGP
ncbi:hypothetical protein HNR21_001622 [Actinomadura cellulosilytica]|uniref:Uncharacterized protein n=1 Tax=Thermomonospora cellulosilytica TaxID=1411118 RepID=A0A7W3MVN1_9ACTN|nr:hypothetical protein [Thermomonospora cellulosilytica]